MSNIKEQICQEIERLKEENRNIRCRHNDKYCTGYDDAFNDLLAFIDSLPEEKPSEDFPTSDEEMAKFLATHPKAEVPEKYKTPNWLFDKQPSEDLEKAASRGGFDYVDEIEAKAPGLPWNDHDVEFGYRDGFIAGSNWKKEQMMNEAVEGVVYRYESYQRIATAIIVDIPREILGNKVKIIIVKEEV